MVCEFLVDEACWLRHEDAVVLHPIHARRYNVDYHEGELEVDSDGA
jgi:hypothetical protein